MFRITIFSLLWSLCAVSQGYCEGGGPFGVDMGAPIANYPSCKKSDVLGWYECATLPKPHASFDHYMIEATAHEGVCSIIGMGREISNDRYGGLLRQEAGKLAAEISKTYGPFDRLNDELSPGSIWREPQDWMMGVKSNERIFAYLWNTDDARPTRISSISIIAFGSSEDSGFISARFSFQNKDKCKGDVENSEAAVFGSSPSPVRSSSPISEYERAVPSAVTDFLANFHIDGTSVLSANVSSCYSKASNHHFPYCLAFDFAAELTLPVIEGQSGFPPTKEYTKEEFDKRARKNLSKHGVSSYEEQTRIISMLRPIVAKELTSKILGNSKPN